MTERERIGLERYGELCKYIATASPEDAQPGDSATDVAIRWHKTIITLRDRVAELEQAKADYEMDTEWQDRLDQCARILEMVDELPERASDFGESVGEKVADMAKWIEANKTVTEKQREALDNMESGAERWLSRR